MNDLMSHKLAFDNQKSNMELKPSPRISTHNHEMELKPRSQVAESVVSYYSYLPMAKTIPFLHFRAWDEIDPPPRI